MRRAFTGRHMFAALVGMFGVVIGVNLLMATLAVRGFSGVVVENTYVASQHFNRWLDKARAQDMLGWSADMERLPNNHLQVVTHSVPPGAAVTATLRRPLGQPDTVRLTFVEVGRGQFHSREQLEGGRWIARVTIAAGSREWSHEAPLP